VFPPCMIHQQQFLTPCQRHILPIHVLFVFCHPWIHVSPLPPKAHAVVVCSTPTFIDTLCHGSSYAGHSFMFALAACDVA
jgi:hypothetical protein